MIDSQAEIDALLAEAEALVAEVPDSTAVAVLSAEPSADTRTASKSEEASRPIPRAEGLFRASCGPRSDDLHRIMRIEVPVIVRLAECSMAVSRIMGLSPGAIIEFEKPADAALDLMVNNKCIGVGQAVKVGEKFGLRITKVGTLEERIEALAGR
ncbi:MAG: FliM/FliN family flagellar motor switch protein [Phycisphaerae bacterium]|nr:FliM/FliN family flagellar motor switch protein [Phycisphaerae bacterium]